MTHDEDVISFTVRLPRELGDQITGRAKLNRRSRNQEIISLLIDAIDSRTAADLALTKP